MQMKMDYCCFSIRIMPLSPFISHGNVLTCKQIFCHQFPGGERERERLETGLGLHQDISCSRKDRLKSEKKYCTMAHFYFNKHFFCNQELPLVTEFSIIYRAHYIVYWQHCICSRDKVTDLGSA